MACSICGMPGHNARSHRIQRRGMPWRAMFLGLLFVVLFVVYALVAGQPEKSSPSIAPSAKSPAPTVAPSLRLGPVK